MQTYLKKVILKQYNASTVLDVDNFEKFIEDVYNLFDNAKYVISTLVGIFGHNYKSKNIHHFTQDYRLVYLNLNLRSLQKLNIFTSPNLRMKIKIINMLRWIISIPMNI